MAQLPNRDVRRFARLWKARGWEFAGFTGGGHVRFRLGDGGPQYTVASSPSDGNAYRQADRDMRRLEEGRGARG